MPRKKGTSRTTRRREQKVAPHGRAYVHSTFNNTIITLTDTSGNVISWGSSGTAGFKGSRKSTAYAAQLAAGGAAQRAMSRGLREVEVYVKGPGNGGDWTIWHIDSSGALRNTYVKPSISGGYFYSGLQNGDFVVNDSDTGDIFLFDSIYGE